MITVKTPSMDDIKAVILDPEIYDKASDDNCPERNEFDLENLLESSEEPHNFIGGYIDGQIAALCDLHNGEIHYEVLKPYRKYARLIWQKIINNYDVKGVARVPIIHKSMINFAKKAGFREGGIVKNAYLKNNNLYDIQILIYRV